ncbi:MAG: hypothetical protein KKE39_05095 [Bacteroidetes bacterium]|nr:hypothetical protein [Bacteroidota bacterium]MBU1374078.1 hypothetical protein [Bacteroidota bacterium]MBU1484582.1 hypothetical protein [Bacteroidota bacterium]MBU1760393.1 hypothetical protein [Bacteroidota bacterium]MBU2267681.1 hypothetical protein [Bacteroidota bacterium]
MNKRFKILLYCNVFIAIFIAKMLISTAPVFLNLDQKVVKAAIMQLELENDSKESHGEAKDLNNILKKGVEFLHVYDFKIISISLVQTIDYHFFSKKYFKTYFPSVPTPPPNVA